MRSIIIVADNLGGGGAEKVLIDILRKFNYNKYNVTLLLLENTGVYIDLVPEEVNIKYIYPKLNSGNKKLNKIYSLIKRNSFRYFSNVIYSLFVKENYDVEIAYLEGLPTKFISKSSKASRKIAWVHTDLSQRRVLSYKSEKIAYDCFHDIVAVSNDAKSSMLKLYPHLEKKVNVIYNILDTHNIKISSNEKIDLNDKIVNVVSVGRLYHTKRFDLLIKAHKKLLDKNIIHNLIIIGDGEEKNNLQTLTKELNVQDSVFFEGFKKNPYSYIKNSDVFVLASDYEGFSLVVAEAMILGKAIISTNCVGPRELLNNGACGIITPVGNIDCLVNNLEEMICNKDKRKYYESKALEQSQLFNEEITMSKIYSVINKSSNEE